MKSLLSSRILKGVLVLLGACGPTAVPPRADLGSSPDQTLTGFTMDTYEGALRSWSLKAPHADIFERDHRVEITKPRVRFFTEGKSSSVVTAERGRLDTETKDFWAGGGVVMVSTEGARLVSDSMRYESATDRIVSTSPVVITRGRSTVTGAGWEARPDLSELQIYQQRGEIAPEDQGLFKKQ